ncbi:MAG: 3-oxoacyl-[acyl-carrier-protein] reductase [candidate division Zixibacteria bacterium]|nr:3-oxoacyl-[acyl-carrier-protein] reductase [candidate division Zixibacteria bacterium]
MDFKGKRALITGGARGIGFAIAEKFTELGADVLISDIDSEALKKAEAALSKSGANVNSYIADISKEDEVNSLFKKIADGGKLDVLVNNAGIIRDVLLVRTTLEDWETVIDINLKGTFLCCRAAAKMMMKARYGRIINMSSITGLMGNVGQVNYTSSKAGIVGMTKSCARELGSRGITVNALAPGFIDTEMTRSLPTQAQEYYLNNIPLKRAGTVEDVANATAFLASDEASFITGQVLAIDGGFSM